MKAKHVIPALTEAHIKAALEKVGIGDVPNFNVSWNHEKQLFEIESNELLHWIPRNTFPGLRTMRLRAKKQAFFDDGTYGINFHYDFTTAPKGNVKIVSDPLVTIFFLPNGFYESHDWLAASHEEKLTKSGTSAKGSIRKNTRTFTIVI